MSDLDLNFTLEHSVAGTILQRTQERLGVLDLPGIERSRIVIRKLPWQTDDVPPPYITVSPPPPATTWQEGTNELDSPVYAAMIAIVLASGEISTKGMGLQLYWRERIYRAFNNRSPVSWPELVLPTGAHFLHAWVESGDQFIDLAKRAQYDAQYLLLRVRVKEPRE
jgi:hypothetical protein